MDLYFKNYMKRAKETREIIEEEKFQEWLSSDNDRNISNAKKITTIAYAILNSLKNSNYEIYNEKAFKDELATYIYRISQTECLREI